MFCWSSQPPFRKGNMLGELEHRGEQSGLFVRIVALKNFALHGENNRKMEEKEEDEKKRIEID